MPYILNTLYSLLESRQKRQFVALQLLITLTALLELASITSIGPFMALVASPDTFKNNQLAQDAINMIGGEQPEVRLGLVVLILISLSTLTSLYTSWKLSRFGARLGADLSSRLYNYYINQDWIFHSSSNSSALTNRIAQETYRVTQGIIQPSLIILSKSILVILLIAGVFILEPMIAMIGSFFFAFCYLLIFQLTKLSLSTSGKKVSEHSEKRLRVISEGFGAIKDTLILQQQDAFSKEFEVHSMKWADHVSNIRVLGQAPRYIMEGITFGSVIGFIALLSTTDDTSLTDFLPKLTVFAFAGLKILPAMQAIFSNISSIKSNAPAFENIEVDLKKHRIFSINQAESMPVLTHGDIQIRHLSYEYPNTKKTILDNLNLDIPQNKTIGIAGPSGSGKSTLIDIICGLIPIKTGDIQIGTLSWNHQKKINWGSKVGYVPQSIFLLDSTIAENIAFGIDPTKICPVKLDDAIQKAHLNELISSLQYGIETVVGERGMQLSGGQRQRIGIARALYHDPEVLIFDEATSALDGISEQKIMEAITGLHGSKTIIMIAHRLSTLKNCDTIFFLEHGEISHQGSFDDLLKASDIFRKMSG